ncbi:MAG: hypothetical protein AAF974_11165 [Cyanobacteria bacterium P01_E01_bin.34]
MEILYNGMRVAIQYILNVVLLLAFVPGFIGLSELWVSEVASTLQAYGTI